MVNIVRGMAREKNMQEVRVSITLSQLDQTYEVYIEYD